MNSPPNWEELLDIDDSDLRQSATTQNMVSYENQVGNSDLRLSATTQNIFSYENPKVENYDEMPVGIIRGPAGIVQTANIRKTTDIQEVVNDEMPVGITQEYIRKVVHDVGEDSDFNSGPWIRAVEYMKSDGGIMIGYFADVNKFLKKGKLEKVIWIIKSCTPNVLGDLTVTLKDVSGLISGTMHHKVVNDERFENKMVVGAVLILHNVSLFSPKQSGNQYLNITLRNVVKVFSDDMVPLEV
ncbi:hypothetical protein CTI12_AA226900 [Artemisia annua]|uniref:Homologous recombination OB-fold protein OB-fold domain-containing protein n=1 Tax=Artemisia annua TaxID=35608 RepID=A0A2U1NUR9_ARTAN|nr:hypothetical protein CTI12_AA226900 [Artemisia annua]